MLRTFQTHDIREVIELSGSGWTFTPLMGEHAGETYPVVVPCCWESLPEFSAYRGTGKFEREFTAEGTVRLVFKGVSHTGTVYVDGEQIGTHYNAFTPFDFIVKNLTPGTHTLTVEADNRFSEASALHIPNDYMTYGGVTRGVAVELIEDAYLEWIHVIPKKEGDQWNAKVRISVANIAEQEFRGTLTCNIETVASFAEEIRIPAGENAVIERTVRAQQVCEWTPMEPKLYQVTALLAIQSESVSQEDDQVIIDDLKDRFGFREITIVGKDILLNGKKLRIKGFCRHEDHPMYGCALPLAAMQQDLQIMKDLGANAVRTSHYPNDELFLDLCDEQGVLVWEENHARGLTEEHMRNPHFEEQAERCIAEMITAHINHPSIIIWGILNECASETEYGKSCYEKQYALIKQMDTSRPRSSASCKFFTDICLGYPEIVSYNLYPEWYVDKSSAEWIKENYDWVQEHTEGAGKPFLITEIGAGAIYGDRTPTMCKWSEEYQALALEHQLKAVFAQEGCSGVFIWQFCDVRISNEWFSNRPRTMNNKGVVDEYRRRKLSYETVKNIFTSLDTYVQ
ncbi:MAG: hypothetical protein K6G23_05185 [Lachnospiraceae bacterium]|nr:hypothetical protein [Lachnospiraceae bacterium]